MALEKTQLDLLLLLLKLKAHAAPARVSTTQLAGELGLSQQTMSRWLVGMERNGLVERKLGAVSLTQKAVSELARVKTDLDAVFESKRKTVFSGKLFTGLGEGGYYISQSQYVNFIEKKLGFAPFPGTLNLRLSEPSRRITLSGMNGLRIPGFESKGRAFGALIAYPAKINGKERGAVVVPERTHYGDDVLEIVSKERLRKKLRINDGDEVEVVAEHYKD